MDNRTQEPRPDGARRIVGELALTGGERIRSFAIVTTPPNELCAELPISPRVGNAKNNDPSLIEPVVLPKVRRCG
jgi:hypothetical protein